MSRPLRIEYPDAWYHVMNRGRRSETIYFDDRDYQLFLTILGEAVGLWNVNICGYCLMPNHYHLLIQTPDANLSRCMRHINGVYTQRFNRRHVLDGSLFRGRFKSILIGDDNYLIQLLRYICFNPVKAGIVKTPGAYPWSCYSDYLSDHPQYQWLNRDLLSERFQVKKQKGKYENEELVSRSASVEIEQFLGKKNLPSILGSKKFVDQIRIQYVDSIAREEKPAVQDLALDSKQIVSMVCQHFGLEQNDILQQKRGVTNTPRDLAIYLIRRESMCKEKEIAQLFNFSGYSGVSTAIERISNLLQKDSSLAATVRLLENQSKKVSQKKT